MLAALYYAVTNLYGASLAQMIVTGLPHEFASSVGGSPEGVGGSFDGMWARVDDALLAMQDATEKYAEEHASLTDIPGAAAAIMLCIGDTIIILLNIGRAHVELKSLMRIQYAVYCLKNTTTFSDKIHSTQHKI